MRAAAGSTGELVLAAATRRLAAAGPRAFDDVVALVRDRIGCSTLVLHTSDWGAPIAGATGSDEVTAVPRQPNSRPWVLDAPVRADGVVLGVLTAAAERPFAAEEAELLTAVADLLALALARPDASAGPAVVGAADPARSVLDAEADRAQTAAELDASVGHALVAARYTAAQVAAGRADPRGLDEPLRAAIEAFRLAQRDLRAYALEGGLRGALHELALRTRGDRPDDGRPALAVTVTADDPRLDIVAPAVAVVVQRVAEAALRGVTGRASVSASYDGLGVKLCVDSADIACDASELDRWARRASALGGDLWVRPDGVELRLPARFHPLREGHHDDGPDL